MYYENKGVKVSNSHSNHLYHFKDVNNFDMPVRNTSSPILVNHPRGSPSLNTPPRACHIDPTNTRIVGRGSNMERCSDGYNGLNHQEPPQLMMMPNAAEMRFPGHSLSEFTQHPPLNTMVMDSGYESQRFAGQPNQFRVTKTYHEDERIHLGSHHRKKKAELKLRGDYEIYRVNPKEPKGRARSGCLNPDGDKKVKEASSLLSLRRRNHSDSSTEADSSDRPSKIRKVSDDANCPGVRRKSFEKENEVSRSNPSLKKSKFSSKLSKKQNYNAMKRLKLEKSLQGSQLHQELKHRLKAMCCSKVVLNERNAIVVPSLPSILSFPDV